MSRFYPNPCPQYVGNNITIDLCAVDTHLVDGVRKLLDHTALTTTEGTDVSVYTGIGGVAYALWHVQNVLARRGSPHLPNLLQRSVELLQQCASQASSLPGVGFYCGAAGIHALSAVVYHTAARLSSSTVLRDRQEVQAREHFNALVEEGQKAMLPEEEDEVLYGRAGYLQAVLFASKHTGYTAPDELLRGVVSVLFERSLPHHDWPLTWLYRRQTYLGAAHGLSGILYVLLCVWEVLDANQRSMVRTAVDHLARRVLSGDGALPAVVGDTTSLNHWCHGAPGTVPLLVKAAVLFNMDGSYLMAARLCASHTWERGLLTKGVGLCHGVSGNAYAFLTLYRATREQRYLYYAYSFWQTSRCPDYQEVVSRTPDPQRATVGVPDAPSSLMEGLAGAACFTADLTQPDFAYFPGYETSTAPPVLMDWIHPIPRDATPMLSIPGTLLCPGVWSIPVMHPNFCEDLRARVAEHAGPHRYQTDAIRLGGNFLPLLYGLASYVQQFVERVMLPGETIRPLRPPEHRPMLAFSTDHLPDFAPYRATLAAGRRIAAPVLKEFNVLEEHRRGVPNRRYHLDIWRAYVIRYDSEHHPSIQSHTDASDITFNLCLARTCAGGTLVFNDAGEEYRHKVGDAVIHWGDLPHHTHNVGPVGERVQLVLLLNWSRHQDRHVRCTLPFLSLGYDAQVTVCTFLPTQTLACIMYANKELYTLANDPTLWKIMYSTNPLLTSFVSIAELESGSHLLDEVPPPRQPVTDPPIFRLRLPTPENEEQTYKQRVVLTGDDWKDAYRRGVTAVGELAEARRRRDAEDSRTMWMAIIGCYHIHNIRQGGRFGASLNEEDDDIDVDDDFVSPTCEECAALDINPFTRDTSEE